MFQCLFLVHLPDLDHQTRVEKPVLLRNAIQIDELAEGEALSDSQWADYVFNRDGSPGIQKEWWYHSPSGTWFIAERNIVKDAFLRTYLFEEGGDDA